MSFFKKLFGRLKEEPQQEPSPVEEAVAPKEEIAEKEAQEELEVEEEAMSEAEDAEREAQEEAEVIESLEADEDELVSLEEASEAELLEDVEELKCLDGDLEEEDAEETELETLEEVAEAELLEDAEELALLEGEVEEVVPEVIDDLEASRQEDAMLLAEEVLEEEISGEEGLVESIEEADREQKTKKKGFFSRLVEGLTKTRDQFMGTVDDVLKGFKKIDEDLYEELEEVLIMADFGVETTLSIMNKLREIVKERKITEPTMLRDTLKEVITGILTSQEVTPIIEEGRQNVILVIGVNGVGKTTTIGKLSNQFKQSGKKVVLAAADTFRAAAIEQLAVWADRAGVDLIKHHEGTDPAAVVYDGIQAAKARKADILICDTAGRLQNKTNLMKELEKIGRIIDREYPDAHKEVLIVLDATTGQNAISQVKVFKEVAQVDGIILTKLDGTAKGGAVVGICESLQVPVKYIGVGEKIDDLQVFDPQAFADALFATGEN